MWTADLFLALLMLRKVTLRKLSEKGRKYQLTVVLTHQLTVVLTHPKGIKQVLFQRSLSSIWSHVCEEISAWYLRKSRCSIGKTDVIKLLGIDVRVGDMGILALEIERWR